MLESVFVIDETKSLAKMRNGLRCDRGSLVVFLIGIILFQCYLYYREQQKWANFTDESRKILMKTQDIWSTAAELRKILGLQGIYEKTGLGEKPTIYAITPTFARPVQKAELTRLAQTFTLVPKFHWIIVEDSVEKTNLVTNLLEDSGIIYTHLNVLTPHNYKLGKNDPNWKKPRGVEQRNAALRWLRENVAPTENGVVYFADDDNTYSVKLFREMDKIKNVGVWPVGLVGGLMVERPICDKMTNKVVGFNAAWKPDRPFPLDMAGFAINVKLFFENKNAEFSFEVRGGYQESEILGQLITRDQLEPLADSCTKVYVWHTRTEPPKLSAEQLLIKKGKRSNDDIEV